MKQVEFVRQWLTNRFLRQFRVWLSQLEDGPELVARFDGTKGVAMQARIVDSILRELGHEPTVPGDARTSQTLASVRKAVQRARGR